MRFKVGDKVTVKRRYGWPPLAGEALGIGTVIATPGPRQYFTVKFSNGQDYPYEPEEMIPNVDPFAILKRMINEL